MISQMFELSSNIPDDVLRCIVGFLKKGDQYKLFSLCCVWKPLLSEVRTFRFTGESEALKEVPNPYLWRWFAMSEDHHQTYLRLVNNSMHRKCSLSVEYEEFCRHGDTLAPYVHYFHTINVTCNIKRSFQFFSDTLINTKECIPTKLINPTKETFTRFLASNWYSVATSLDSWENIQHALNNLRPTLGLANITDVAETNIIISFPGIEKIWIKAASKSIFVSPSSTLLQSRLHTILLDDCKSLTNANGLHNINNVQLYGCHNVTDIFALSKAHTVHIVDCRQLRDLSPLASVHTVVLQYCYLEDISMLHTVSQLSVHDCGFAKYPVPSWAAGQAWLFDNCNITDFEVATLGRLERLTLVNCRNGQDISKLGTVQYLTIKACGQIRKCQFPSPSGKWQEWCFTDMHMADMDMCTFTGLFKLTFQQCKLYYLADFVNIVQLELAQCTFNSLWIDNVTVKELTITEYELSQPQEKDMLWELGTNIAVEYIHVTMLQQQTSSHSTFLAFFQIPTLRELRVHTKYHTARFYQEDFHDVQDKSKKFELHLQYGFDNVTLRTAVALWYTNEAQARNIYGDINSWEVGQVTDMNYLFQSWNTLPSWYKEKEKDAIGLDIQHSSTAKNNNHNNCTVM